MRKTKRIQERICLSKVQRKLLSEIKLIDSEYYDMDLSTIAHLELTDRLRERVRTRRDSEIIENPFMVDSLIGKVHLKATYT